MTCPSFEELSQFADRELSPAAQAEIQAHLASCARCADVGERLSREVGPPSTAKGGGIGGTGCASPERLISYLLSDAAGGEAAIEAHLRQCDACTEQVAAIGRRLRHVAEIAAPVPAEVAARAREAALIEAPSAARASSPRLRGLLTRLTRLPILVPTALAAGALFTVAVESQWPSQPRVQMRSLPRRTVAVSEDRAPLFSQPDAGAAVLASVKRGDVLEVRDEVSGWYRVVLDDGREGWIEGHACE